MGSKAARAERQRQREDNTALVMENIMAPGAGEISKAREAELQKAANFGRGVQLLPPSTTVQGLTQAGGQPVMLTNPNFQPRIVANKPTIGEAGGDILRGLFGGQAEKPFFTSPDAPPGRETGMDFANMLPAPERTQGIIPAIINTGGITGVVLNALRDLIPGQGDQTTTTPMPSGFTTDQAFFIPQDASAQGLQREPLVGIIERNRLKQFIESDNAPGSEGLDVDTMSDNEVLLRLRSYEENLAGGGRVGFKNGGDSSNILMNFRDAFSEIIGFPSYVLRDEQEFLNDLLEDPDDLSMKEIKAQMKSENAPTRKYLNNLSDEEKKDALNKIIDYREKTRLGRTSGLFEALKSLRGRGMAMAGGGLTPPESGPQSEGIESLFKNK